LFGLQLASAGLLCSGSGLRLPAGSENLPALALI
jgi:hypothetical protein